MILRLRQLAAFEGAIALLNQQPVAVSLEQAVPLVAARAIRVHFDGFTQLGNRPRPIAALGVRLPQCANRVAVFGIRPHSLLQIGHGHRTFPGLHRRQPLRAIAERRVF